jgi:Winged helix DNA-binding domain
VFHDVELSSTMWKTPLGPSTPPALSAGRRPRRIGCYRQRVADRVLTLRELNRATLARQLLLERKRLSPTKVIERLVGMQAQSPQAPFIGIWTRTTSFRRGSLEREIVSGAILRATAMRQTLHLVTRRDFGLVRSAMRETNYPWEEPQFQRMAPTIRALVADGPITSAEGQAWVERKYGLKGYKARRAWRYGRVAAHVLHHHESALWESRADGRFVAVEEPERHDPT